MNVELRNYVSHVRIWSNNPLNPPGVGQFFLGESQSRIYPHMRAKFGRGPTVVSKKKGGCVQTHKLWKFYKYVRYNTANNVSNCGGDPVTQLIVNVYQIIV